MARVAEQAEEVDHAVNEKGCKGEALGYSSGDLLES